MHGEGHGGITVLTQADACAILGVAPPLTREQLQRAYRRAALRHHPDRNPGDPGAAARFTEAQRARDLLLQSIAAATAAPAPATEAPRPAPGPVAHRAWPGPVTDTAAPEPVAHRPAAAEAVLPGFRSRVAAWFAPTAWTPSLLGIAGLAAVAAVALHTLAGLRRPCMVVGSRDGATVELFAILGVLAILFALLGAPGRLGRVLVPLATAVVAVIGLGVLVASFTAPC